MNSPTLEEVYREPSANGLRIRDANMVISEFLTVINLSNSNDFMLRVREKLTLPLIGLIQRETAIAYRRGYHDAWKDHERLHADEFYQDESK